MRAARSAASIARHAGGAATEALLVAGIVAILAIAFSPLYGPARTITGADQTFAKGQSSIWIDQASGTASTLLSFKQDVDFGFSSATAQSVQLQCFQPVDSKNLVFSTSEMLPGGSTGTVGPFQLGPSLAWSGGDATCKALLGHRSNSGKYQVDASITFAVSG